MPAKGEAQRALLNDAGTLGSQRAMPLAKALPAFAPSPCAREPRPGRRTVHTVTARHLKPTALHLGGALSIP
jgi:hypothetical protein